MLSSPTTISAKTAINVMVGIVWQTLPDVAADLHRAPFVGLGWAASSRARRDEHLHQIQLVRQTSARRSGFCHGNLKAKVRLADDQAVRVADDWSLLMAAIAVHCAAHGAGAEELNSTSSPAGATSLFDGDAPYRFISFNIPNLMVIEDAYEFTKPNPWRWPDEFEIEDALESVRQMGGQVVRTYVLSVHREGSDMGESVHVLGRANSTKRAFVRSTK